MSKISIILIIIIVVVIILIGSLLYVSLTQRSASVSSTQQNNTVTNVQSGVTPTPINVSSTNSKDISDAAINGDLSAIDTQMRGLVIDSNNINQSLNNQ